jgi:hypothetical protein
MEQDEEEEEENEDLEDFEEDESLNQLDSENLDKFIQSFDLYLEDPDEKARKYLLTDNLVTFLDNMPNIKNYEYSGFKDLLAKISTKIDEAKNKTKDSTILSLLDESLGLIKNYLGDYYSYKSKQKYEYPKYSYKKSPYQPSKAPKQLVDEIVKSLTHRDPREETTPLLSDIAHEIAGVHDGLIPQPKEETEDPEVTKILNESLQKLLTRKNEYQQKLTEARELSNRKIELSDKKTELKNFRERMLGKFIDSLIAEGKGE